MSAVAERALYRWWLRLQVGIGAAGAVAGVVGIVTEEDFFLGVGVGLLTAALALRFGRRASPDGPRFGGEQGP